MARLWSKLGQRLALKVVPEPILTLSDGSFLVSNRRFFGLSHRRLRAVPGGAAQRAAAVGRGTVAAGERGPQRAGEKSRGAGQARCLSLDQRGSVKTIIGNV